MKITPKKILFPFFIKDRHTFLMKKWWFRLLIVLYIIGIIVTFYIIQSKSAYSAWGWCYDLAILGHKSFDEFSQRMNECGDLMAKLRTEVILGSLLFTVVIHYVIQLIFFKVIINFIALSGKKNL